MLPQERESMLGIYERPKQLDSTLMDEIVYTNDFREACSWVIDQIAEMYVCMKPLIVFYAKKNPNDKPPLLISEILNPYRNNIDPKRCSNERYRYHAQITSRYVEGEVPTEDGGKMIRAMMAWCAILRALHDCPELERFEESFNDYTQLWNCVCHRRWTPAQFASNLYDAAQRIVDRQKELSMAWRTWEGNVWPFETQFKFGETDTIVLNDRLTRMGENVLRKQSKLESSFAHRGSETLHIEGPSSEDKKRQVYEVVVYLANPRHAQSLHNACAFAYDKLIDLKDGYDSMKSLYRWCKRNEARIMEWVQIYRTERAIEA